MKKLLTLILLGTLAAHAQDCTDCPIDRIPPDVPEPSTLTLVVVFAAIALALYLVRRRHRP